MKIFRDVSLDDFLFDLFLAEDLFNRTYCSEQDEGRLQVAFAIALILRSKVDFRTNVESYETLRKILLETGKRRVSILHADGQMKGRVWCYLDNGKEEPIQYWIDQKDREGYGALIIACCNEEKVKPLVRTTPLFYAEGRVGVQEEYRTLLLKPKRTY